MLRITVPEQELWDEVNEKLIRTKEQTLTLEHSLVSVSKWESKWHKPFLEENGKMSAEETLDYVRCMTLTQNVDPIVYMGLTPKNISEIGDYISAPMTATVINEPFRGRAQRERLTNELLYYYMTEFNIPFECQKWHLNRLLTLIRVCSVKRSPKRKMSRSEIMRQNAAINSARRKKFKTKG